MIYIASFTKSGADVANKLEELFESAQVFAKYPLSNERKLETHSEFTKEAFEKASTIIYIGAIGIAVRSIAPFIKHKADDPAVIVIDDKGMNVIPILSGHIGGANKIAHVIAEKLSASAIITTATDIHGKFAIDVWATENDCYISDHSKIKTVTACILRGEKCGIYSDYDIEGNLPDGFIKGDANIGVAISTDINTKPFNETLVLVPKVYALGVGCKRGKTVEEIAVAFNKFCLEHSIDSKLIFMLASIDVKQDEQGLIEFAYKHKLPFKCYSAGELSALEGDFTASNFVSKTVGVDNVSERSAVKASNGELIIKKSAYEGITFALAKRNFVCKF